MESENLSSLIWLSASDGQKTDSSKVVSFIGTVKPAVAATSIKRDPPLSGHLRAPRTILNANAPF